MSGAGSRGFKRGIRRVAGLAAALGVAAFVAAGCTSGSTGATVLDPTGGSSVPGTSSPGTSVSTGNRIVATNLNTVNSGTAVEGGRLTFALAGAITNWNPATPDGDSTEFFQIADQFMPSAFTALPDLSTVQLNSDLLVSAQQTGTSPQTVVYKIQPSAVWSDGQPISADDFIWTWKANNGVDCTKCETAGFPGYDDISSVVGSDSGKTVTVTFSTPFADWKSLFSGPGLFPAHIAKQHGDMASAFNDYFAKSPPTWSGGPWVVSDATDQAVTLKPNPKWYGTVKPHLSELVFRIFNSETDEATALASHDVDAIAPAPTVDLIPSLKAMASSGVVYQLDPGLTWEHVDLNLKTPALKNVALRRALFTAINTQQIIDATVGQVEPDAKPIGSLMYLPGQPGYNNDAAAAGYGKGDVAKAKDILSAAGYTGVGTKLVAPDGKAVQSLRCRWWSTKPFRADECSIVADAAKSLGVTVTMDPTDNFGPDIAGKHDYDIVIFSWDGAPFPSSGAVQLWTSNSPNNFGGYSNANVDKWLKEAASATDPSQIPPLLHKADVQLMSDAYSLPLYQSPKLLAYYKEFVNIRNNATNWGPAYNTQEWGKSK